MAKVTQEQFEAEQAKLPGVPMAIVGTDDQAIIRAPTRMGFRAYRIATRSPEKIDAAREKFVESCLIGMSSADFMTLLERKPVIAEVWCGRILELGGGNELDAEKKTTTPSP